MTLRLSSLALAGVLWMAKLPAAPADLNGIWSAPQNINADIQSAIVDPPDHRIPYLPAAAEQQKENFRKRAQDDPVSRCFMPGVPRLLYLPGDPFMIVDTPGFVAILSQFMHNVRNIPVDGSKHLENIDLWLGDSRGRRDGDTLVVDTTDFNDMTWFDAAGNFHSDELHVVERFTRSGPDTIAYEATMTDPKVFSKPWTVRFSLTRNPDKNAQILEDECHYKREGPTFTEGTKK